jgi:hypothetical protein
VPRVVRVQRVRPAPRVLAVVLAAAPLLLATGCGSAQDVSATTVARRFATALQDADAEAACGYLAPATLSDLERSAGLSCPQALGEEDLPAPGAVEGTATYGTMSQVRFSSDTLFLTRFPDGWRVMAAGCSPQPGQPYDCRVRGG